jgi:cobalt-zinc-cadmium efflux system outer membrane protein
LLDVFFNNNKVFYTPPAGWGVKKAAFIKFLFVSFSVRKFISIETYVVPFHRNSVELSQNNLRLAKANRAIDLELNLGDGYSSEVRNEIAPAPVFKGITAGIGIPLKFSNMNKGALRVDQPAAMQNRKQYEAVELQIASEVARTYNRYKTACRQAERFYAGMLNKAETILKKKIYSYGCGEASILEALNAQRTY